MFSSTTRAVHVQHLRDLLAEAQQEAHSLNSEYQQVAERPVGSAAAMEVALVAVVPSAGSVASAAVATAAATAETAGMAADAEVTADGCM